MGHNCFLIWDDWLSCDPITPYKETIVPHLVTTLIYLSHNYSNHIWGDMSPLRLIGAFSSLVLVLYTLTVMIMFSFLFFFSWTEQLGSSTRGAAERSYCIQCQGKSEYTISCGHIFGFIYTLSWIIYTIPRESDFLSPQQTQNICITVIQCWPNVEDVGPTLYICYTNVLCLLGWYLTHLKL